ncbi:MAG: histidine--tRNA ligase [Phycisphaerales bacterium]
MSDQGEKRTFRTPKGTRDFFPETLLKRRYITETWRRVALRHGFDEIDGPTFEHLDLYTVKSGEGIVSELFSFTRHGGEETYALRPEFTPTLARMYAARAKQLPVPTKWFCIPTFYRAERPQRGRLREFLQWNVDILGPSQDQQQSQEFSTHLFSQEAELISLATDSLENFGLKPRDLQVHINHREWFNFLIFLHKISKDTDGVMRLLDAAKKIGRDSFQKELLAVTNNAAFVEKCVDYIFDSDGIQLASEEAAKSYGIDPKNFETIPDYVPHTLDVLYEVLRSHDLLTWTTFDHSIVRGLAYYTGTVFEVIAEGERAVAGGGRYDGLVELLGGPPTPAVGFAMGDVVLANLLEDKGLMPEGAALLEALDQPVPTRCEAFVISNGSEGAEETLPRVLAELRRGERAAGAKPWEYVRRPIHARRSYKATRNVGKLLKDASAVFARFAVILEDGEVATVRDLDTREEWSGVGLGEIWEKIAR